MNMPGRFITRCAVATTGRTFSLRMMGGATNSSIALEVGNRDHSDLKNRYVIRDGSTYYVANIQADSDGTSTLTGDTAGLQWAAFNPDNFDSYDLSTDLIAGLSFSAMTFDNVTGGGVLGSSFQTGKPAELDIGTFELALIPEPATIGMLGLGAMITMFIRRKLRL